MGETPPRFNGGGLQFLQAVTDYFSPALIKSRLSGLDVPLPGANPGPPENIPHAFVLLCQLSAGQEQADAQTRDQEPCEQQADDPQPVLVPDIRHRNSRRELEWRRPQFA